MDAYSAGLRVGLAVRTLFERRSRTPHTTPSAHATDTARWKAAVSTLRSRSPIHFERKPNIRPRAAAASVNGRGDHIGC